MGAHIQESAISNRINKLLIVCLSVVLLSACATGSNVGFRQQVNFAPPPATDPAPLHQEPQAIAAALARGGYIIYLRHGRTQYGQIDVERQNREAGKLDLDRCETQRNLSPEGHAEMKTAGDQFRRAGLPIDRAWSSRYCRAKESAAYFVDGALAVQDLSGEGEFGIDPSIKGRVQAFFSQKPAPGKNHFMMAHGGIFWLATGFSVQEGHAVVLDPGNPKVIVARIGPAQWGAVAQARK